MRLYIIVTFCMYVIQRKQLHNFWLEVDFIDWVVCWLQCWTKINYYLYSALIMTILCHTAMNSKEASNKSNMSITITKLLLSSSLLFLGIKRNKGLHDILYNWRRIYYAFISTFIQSIKLSIFFAWNGPTF